MAIEDDDRPRKKVTHEIGQDLSLLSVEELTERIALMTSEIERLQVDLAFQVDQLSAVMLLVVSLALSVFFVVRGGLFDRD